MRVGAMLSPASEVWPAKCGSISGTLQGGGSSRTPGGLCGILQGLQNFLFLLEVDWVAGPSVSMLTGGSPHSTPESFRGEAATDSGEIAVTLMSASSPATRLKHRFTIRLR